MKIYVGFLIASMLITLALYAGIGYIVVHFVHKLW